MESQENEFNVWIADDSPVNRVMLKKRLEKHNESVRVRQFCDGKELRDGLAGVVNGEESPYDLLITDKNMPEYDGMDLLEEYCILIGKPTAIWTTDSSLIAERAYEFGAFACLSKPTSSKNYEVVLDYALAFKK